jgi:hypothetical protein
VTYQGRFARALERAPYATYLVHAPIVVALSVTLAGLAVGVVASYGVGWLVTRR